MSKIKVRINGRGNAWPVLLGQEHPFYYRNNPEDLANASCSILKSKSNHPQKEDIEWDLMIDAGHGAVQYLLKNCNRIPETVFITHPHIDHTLGLDWIVQSYYKQYKKRYPVYATIFCWEIVKNTFPQLINLVEFKELTPYQERVVSEVQKVTVTPFPVYHGKSALGASMFLFQVEEKERKSKILFTGDVLCPLLRDIDYSSLEGIDLLVADANNRYPYPKSNHWSVLQGLNNQKSDYLIKFQEQSNIATFLYPHLQENISGNYCRCFDYFLNRPYSSGMFYFTIESFVKKIKPDKIVLLHYSGAEDEKYHNQPILNTKELGSWHEETFKTLGINIRLIIPYVSQHINFLTL